MSRLSELHIAASNGEKVTRVSITGNRGRSYSPRFVCTGCMKVSRKIKRLRHARGCEHRTCASGQ